MIPGDLSWQLEVLLVETLVSLLLGFVIVGEGWWRRSPRTALVFGTWDVALLALLVTGDSQSWQHVVLFGWYCLDLGVVVSTGLANHVHKPKDNLFGTLFSATVLSVVILWLIVAGAR